MLDIGANIGYFTVLGSKARNIIAVEPLTELVPILSENIRLNDLSNKCKVINAAVGPKGKLLIEKQEKMNLSRIVTDPSLSCSKIESIPLDELVTDYGVNIIRLDVEGFEYEILLEKIPLHVNKISIEFHVELMGKKKSKELLDYLKKQGFMIECLIDDIPLIFYPALYLFKRMALFSPFSKIVHDLSIDESLPYIFDGRSVKHLFLTRSPPNIDSNAVYHYPIDQCPVVLLESPPPRLS